MAGINLNVIREIQKAGNGNVEQNGGTFLASLGQIGPGHIAD
jgi:hypothetical protein